MERSSVAVPFGIAPEGLNKPWTVCFVDSSRFSAEQINDFDKNVAYLRDHRFSTAASFIALWGEVAFNQRFPNFFTKIYCILSESLVYFFLLGAVV